MSGKALIKNNYAYKTMRQMFMLLCTDQSLRDMFPQIAAIGALVSVNTAKCECAFSAMYRMKTKIRNRLKTSTLNCLMQVSIEGPPVAQFNFKRAADIWGGMHNQRLSIGHLSSSSSS